MTRIAVAALVLFVAGKCLLAPGKHTVYDEYAQAGLDFWSGEPVSFVARQYLPYFSLALSPLALLPERLGQLAWALSGLALYLSGLRLFFRAAVLPSLRGLDPGRAWAAFLACALLIGLPSLANEQANVLIAGLLLHGFAAVAQRRWRTAAICLGLPAFKLYPLALGLVLAVMHPRRLLPRLLAVVAGLLAVPWLALPPAEAWQRYAWIADYAQEGIHSLKYHLVGVRELLEQHGVELSLREFFPLQAAAGGAIAALLLLRQRLGDGEESLGRRAFVLVSLWFVTFGPSVEAPTYLLAAPALGWLLLRAVERRAWTAFGFVLGTAILCGPAQTSLFGIDAQRWLARTRPACLVLALAFAWQLLAALPPARLLLPRPSLGVPTP